MNDARTQRIFRWLDRSFWLIWLAFPALVWLVVREILAAPETLAALAPEQAACLADLPLLDRFTTAGQAIFWTGFAVEFAVYAVLLALAHGVVHRCATGQVLVAQMIVALRRIGLVIAGWPLLDLLIVNLSEAAYVATGDMPFFRPTLALDLPVLGVGLLLLTMSVAMAQAVRLREDADLTI